MKKVLSIVLSLTMVCALALPSFAASTATTITKADGSPKDTTIVVKTSTTTDGSTSAESYSVVIPADLTINWNDTTAKDMNYTVTSQLLEGKKLSVAVAAVASGTMTSAGGSTLTYTLTGGASEDFSEVNTAKAPTTNVTVNIASFAGVPVAEYSGTLTYTVTYGNA